MTLTLPGSSAGTSSSGARYVLSPLTAEFVDGETEFAFRESLRSLWVRDTRRAMVMAALFYLAFAVSDVFMLSDSEALTTVILSRLLVCCVGLFVAFTADRFWRALVNGVSPTVVVTLAMISFLSFTLLFPFDVGWHSMGMMLMLLGVYVFIPNRFLPALAVAVLSTLAFIALMASNFDFGVGQTLILTLVFFGMNLFSAVSAARVSRLTRENFRDAQVLREANQRLGEEAAIRQRLEHELIEQVHLDALTGVANRRKFDERSGQAVRLATKAGYPVCLMLMAVDHLRQIHNSYGHERADEVLKHVVHMAAKCISEHDELFRLDEERFAVLLQASTLKHASEVAAQMGHAVQRTPVMMRGSNVRISISLGVVQWSIGEALPELMSRADASLQQAVVEGGQCVVAEGKKVSQHFPERAFL